MFVIGLSPRLADPEVLKKTEYFGKYGKIYKVVINNHTIYNGAQVRDLVCGAGFSVMLVDRHIFLFHVGLLSFLCSVMLNQ